MTGERIVITLIVAGAVAYLLRLVWRRYVSKTSGSCCSGAAGKGKHVSLTLKGRTVRR